MPTQRIPCGGRALSISLSLSLAAVAGLAAQQQDGARDSLATTVQSLDGRLLELLPADQVDDLLPLRPGITATDLGQPSLRGSGAEDAALYLDGIPLLSGFRGSAFFRSGPFDVLDARATPGTNALEAVDATTGPLRADAGNGRAGAIAYRSRTMTGPLGGSIRYESDEATGGSSLGFNRIEGAFGGSLASRLSLFMAGVLEGQRASSFGFEADRAPVFVPAGVDTIVQAPDLTNSGAMIPFTVYDYAISRGDCDAFAQSANGEIGDNFGLGCAGARTPASTVSNYQWIGKAAYDFASGGRISSLALASQEQNRDFDYGNLENPQALRGNRGTGVAYALSLGQPLLRTASGQVRLEAYLSHQRDRELSGPLLPEAAADLTAPFGGFRISPLEHRFDFKSFPVDEELIRNYRLNIPGSRRSPFDLENRAQYAMYDTYRNNAYGLYHRGATVPLQFYDGGGPEGRLTLYRENRWVGGATVDWPLSDRLGLRIGGEVAWHTIGSYSHLLTDQIGSDVYLERPKRSAWFAETSVRLGPGTLAAGLRFDRFRTGARRPAGYPVISTHPLFDPENPEDDVLFPEDEAHGHLSPRLHLALPVSASTMVRMGYADQAQMPDLRRALAHINSDINLMGPGEIFGSDLDFERTRIYEIGLHHRFGERTSVDAAVYRKQYQDNVVVRFSTAPDPTSGTSANFLRYENGGRDDATGLDLRLDRQFGSEVTASLAYSYQDAVTTVEAGFLTPELEQPMFGTRPHALAGILAIQLAPDWRRGSTLGAVMNGLGLFMTFRAASGSTYSQCVSTVALSNEDCFITGPDGINSQRLPSFKQLDLRLTKAFALGGRTLTAYLDARNLLNSRNVLAVFAASGETENPQEQEEHRLRAVAEYAFEAERSGALLPDGSVDLRFGGLADPRAGCGNWQTPEGISGAPNCVYLIRAEERFGNGDHVFDVTEQERAADALYRVLRGAQNLTGPPRRVRLGIELAF